MNLPFMLNLSKIADAVTVSNTFPHCDGVRFVVTMVVASSVLFEWSGRGYRPALWWAPHTPTHQGREQAPSHSIDEPVDAPCPGESRHEVEEARKYGLVTLHQCVMTEGSGNMGLAFTQSFAQGQLCCKVEYKTNRNDSLYYGRSVHNPSQ